MNTNKWTIEEQIRFRRQLREMENENDFYKRRYKSLTITVVGLVIILIVQIATYLAFDFIKAPGQMERNDISKKAYDAGYSEGWDNSFDESRESLDTCELQVERLEYKLYDPQMYDYATHECYYELTRFESAIDDCLSFQGSDIYERMVIERNIGSFSNLSVDEARKISRMVIP